VIYTSGTTGRPKGVMIEHRNIASLVASDIAEFGLTTADRVVQGSSSAYDSSLEETWLAFATGATLLVMDDAAARLGPDIVGWLRDERATVFCPPPTLLRSSGCADPERAARPQAALRGWRGAAARHRRPVAEGPRLVNGYGPTECAVTCLRGDIVPGKPITIGAPVPGMHAWVLDEALDEVAEGMRGELCMGGAGVARGYRNRPDLTAEKFCDHPRLGRIYRTGDLVHREADGNFYYHGRIDAQVKLRGYRVELGEIEARLAELPGVRAAGCRMQDHRGVPELVAFVVADDPRQPPDLDALRGDLLATLPRYMVPREIALIDDLPTTVGGKLNRAALPLIDIAAPATGAATGSGRRAEPASEMERLLAAGMADILKRGDGVSVEDDFFEDLGGDSLSAALLVTLLRDDPRTDWITVSDIYEARTVRALARLADRAMPAADAADEAPLVREGVARPLLASGADRLAAGRTGGGRLADVVRGVPGHPPPVRAPEHDRLRPACPAGGGGRAGALCAGGDPVRGAGQAAGGGPLSRGARAGVEHALPAPLGGVPGGAADPLAADPGHGGATGGAARAGRADRPQRPHRARGDLRRGGWDLLTIGDNAALGQDAHIGLSELDRGDIVFGAVTIGEGATLGVRAGVEAIATWARAAC
jgi:acyl carrier protein